MSLEQGAKCRAVYNGPLTVEEKRRIDKINVLFKMYDAQMVLYFLDLDNYGQRRSKPFIVEWTRASAYWSVTRKKSYRRIKDVEQFAQRTFDRLLEG